MTNHTGSVNGSSPGGPLLLHLEHPRGRTYGMVYVGDDLARSAAEE